MSSNIRIIRATYEGPSEQNGRNLMQALASNAVWIEAEGFPYAGSYTGPAAIAQGVFHRLSTEWTGYRAEVKSYVAEGNQVVAFGTYHGTYKATGKSMQADFAHHYHLEDGKIVRMKQYVDSHTVQQALIA